MNDKVPVIPKTKNNSGPTYTPRLKRRAVVIPVADWAIAWLLFMNRDERGRIKPPSA